MRVLDLFAGSRSISREVNRQGHEAFSTDITDFGGIDYVCDILEFDARQLPWKPDVIWASPPCTGFSVAAIGHHWNREQRASGGFDYIPQTETARLGIAILNKTLDIIRELQPELWFIENPRGMMRKMPQWDDIYNVRHTVTYCQYGETRMKPTDIWTNSEGWVPRPMCKNGAPCHEAAPRGSQTGTQGIRGNHDRSKIPVLLCREVVRSSAREVERYDLVTDSWVPPHMPVQAKGTGPQLLLF